MIAVIKDDGPEPVPTPPGTDSEKHRDKDLWRASEQTARKEISARSSDQFGFFGSLELVFFFAGSFFASDGLVIAGLECVMS